MDLVIKPERRLQSDWKEVWAFRELFYFFAWRDVKVRYKQTVIGAFWAILQPFIMMIVFTVFFNKLAGISSGSSVPYPVFVFSGLLFWTYFNQALSRASDSLVANQGVITKVYFPRIIVPLSAPVVPLVDFAFSLLIFTAILIYYGIMPSLLGIVLLVPMVLLTSVLAAGLGLFLASLNVRYRDVRQALPFFLQMMLFITPVIYPVALVPERLRILLYLNPMTGIISTMRVGLTGQGQIDWLSVGLSLVIAALCVLLGLEYFRRHERVFSDII